MQFKNTLTTYGSVAKFFHWLIFLLLFFMIIYGFLLAEVPKAYQAIAYNSHKLIGLTILLLMMLRGLWALGNVKPLLPPETPDGQRMAERVVHFLLYLSVIAMPLLGWVGSVAAGRPPHIGNILITLPIASNKALAELLLYLHGSVAILLIVLVTIHAGAAFYHHFIKHDAILRRMLPGWWGH